ncbi:MAG: bacillithiol biosynthesis cysteine-adding enzyme BshC [Cytophagales bacterium]
MNFSQIDFLETGMFSKLFLDYFQDEQVALKWANYTPDLKGLENKIRKRSFDVHTRKVLVEALKNQYIKIDTPNEVITNIALLKKENTFTVTCGHQLNIFTGPLYFIYKIVSTIKLAELLNQKFPEFNFVPIYWMATEDHDFEEINHFNLFGKTYKWDLNTSGAVGRIHTQQMATFLDQLPIECKEWSDFYKNSETLAEASQKLVTHLFGNSGLIVINPDDVSLRNLFKEYVKKEIIKRESIHHIEHTNNKLVNDGYKTQVHAREINLMYLSDNLRERIVFEDNLYKILNTNLVFTESEILNLIDAHPENFSTNVIMRPVYQETILPNIAFIGGPAEVVYWLQLKDLFSYFEVDMPVVLARNFAMLINENQHKKIEKLSIEYSDFFVDEQKIKQKLASQDFVLNFDNENINLENLKTQYAQKSNIIDQNLNGTVEAEFAKIQKQLHDLQKKVIKTAEKKSTDKIEQFQNLKSKLFPDNSPQERFDNILNFISNYPNVIENLFKVFHPLSNKYYIINLNKTDGTKK